MKLLVTGACGYIGSSVALQLKAYGHRVVGLDSFNDYYAPAIKRRTAALLHAAEVEIEEVDLAVDSVKAVVNGVDAVIHLAAQPGISATTPWEDYHRNNILATHRLVEAAVGARTPRFINISSSSVYGLNATGAEATAPQPASWYGVTKLAAEQEVMAAHRANTLPACSLRLFSVYGERERPEKLFPKLIHAIMNNTEFSLFDGSLNHQRSFTYVGDICRGIACALEKWPKAEGEIFNLGTTQCFTTGDAIRLAEELLGREVRIKILPARFGDQTATRANIDKAQRLLGWHPETELREGLKRMIAWYLSGAHSQIASP